MEALLPEVRRQIIADFYGKNVSKGKMYTFEHFQKMGCKKTAIYRVMRLVDAGESVAQKEGQGRPRKLTSAQEKKVKLAFNNKKNASIPTMASKLNVSHITVRRSLKRQGVNYRKKKRAPEVKEDQERRIREACSRLSTNYYPPDSSTAILIDDESYFTFRNDSLSINSGFWTDNFDQAPIDLKFRKETKFPVKLLVSVVISEKGMSAPYFTPAKQAMDGVKYRKNVIRKLVKPFIDQHHNDGDYFFWPDLASCHYAQETTQLFDELGIKFIPRADNPPNVPHLRPIENFWAMLKRAVYANGYVAKSLEALKRRIQEKISEADAGDGICLFRSIKSNIEIMAREGPYATFH